MTIRAVVFDIGGVLEQTPRTGWIDTWEAQLNLQPGELEERLEDVWRAGSLGQISEADVTLMVGSRLGLDPSQVDAFMNDLWIEYLGTLDAKLVAFFGNLRPRYRTAIISNSFVGAREKEEVCYQFDTLCDLIIYSHEVGIEKPDRRIFELACERLDVQPSEVIFLDDVEEYVRAARALGMQAILFQSTSQAIAEIEAMLRTQAS